LLSQIPDSEKKSSKNQALSEVSKKIKKPKNPFYLQNGYTLSPFLGFVRVPPPYAMASESLFFSR